MVKLDPSGPVRPRALSERADEGEGVLHQDERPHRGIRIQPRRRKDLHARRLAPVFIIGGLLTNDIRTEGRRGFGPKAHICSKGG